MKKIETRKEKLENITKMVIQVFFSGILMIREQLKFDSRYCEGIGLSDIFCYVITWIFSTMFCSIPLYICFGITKALTQLIFPEIIAVIIAVWITIKIWCYTAGILGIVVVNIGD